jgi:hypothetical protein
MSGIRQRTHFGALLGFSLYFLGASAATAAGYIGRPIVDVLAELRGPGLDFIQLRAAATQPYGHCRAATDNRLLIAREILAARGLSLTVVRPGLFAVTSHGSATNDRMAHGRILSAVDGHAIPNAAVRLVPIQAVDWTNAEGRYAIGPVPEGSYTLRVEADGFAVAEVLGVVVGEDAAEPVVRLTPATAELGEIVVATSRYTLDRFGTMGAVQVTGDALAAQPAPGEDALRTLGRLPGMAQGGLSAQSNIRGSETGELLTLLDGFRCAKPFTSPPTPTSSA